MVLSTRARPATSAVRHARGRTGALAEARRTGTQLLGVRLVTYGVGFAASALIARGLGPGGKGLAAVPSVVTALAVTMSHLGLEHANVHLAARGVPLRVLWANATRVSLVLGAASWVVVGGVRLVAPAAFGDVPLLWMALSLGLVPLLLQNLYRFGLLQLHHRVTAAAAATLGGVAAHAVAVAVLAAAGRLTPFSVVVLLWLTNGTTWLLLRRTGRRARLDDGAPSWAALRVAIGFGLRAHAGIVFVFLLFRVDQLLVGRMLGFEALGLYALATMLAELLWLVTDPFAQAMLPHQVSAAASDDRRLATAAARSNLRLAAVLAAVGWVGAPLAIRLVYGQAYADSAGALRWLLPGVVAMAAIRPLGAALLKEGRPLYTSACGAAALVANVAMIALLVPRRGIDGAAVASSVAYTGLVVAYAAATRGTDAGWRDLVRAGRRRPLAGLRLRIAFVIGTLDRGGTEGQVVRLAAGLARRGHAVTIVCLSRGGAHADAVRAAGAEVVEAGFTSVRRPVRTAAALWRVFAELRRSEADVVHCFLYHSELVGIPLARLAGVPRVLGSRRSLRSARGARPLLRPLEQLCNRLADAVVCNAVAVRDDAMLDGVPPRKTVVVPNAVDVAAWTPPPSSDVLCVANLRPGKGHDDLLRAWAIVRARRGADTPRLRLAGAGVEEERLRRLAETLGIASDVEFLGSVPDIGPLIERSAFTVLASHSEGSPNAVLESLARGRAVVATDVGGIPELVRPGAGILVPPGSPEALAAAIMAMGSPGAAEAAGRAACASVAEHHDPDATVDAHLEVYRS